MTNLAAFLLARIAEDEFIARCVITSPGRRRIAQGIDDLEVCVAKRQIVEKARPTYAVVYSQSDLDRAKELGQDRVKIVAGSGPIWPYDGAEAVLKDLATDYADHPDFDPDWLEARDADLSSGSHQ